MWSASVSALACVRSPGTVLLITKCSTRCAHLGGQFAKLFAKQVHSLAIPSDHGLSTCQFELQILSPHTVGLVKGRNCRDIPALDGCFQTKPEIIEKAGGRSQRQ